MLQIKYDELATFSEVLAVGTAASVVPIRSISRKSTSDKFNYLKVANEPGPCSLKLLTALKCVQQGKVEDTFGWLEPVQEVTMFKSRVTNQNGTSNGMNGHS
jgi:branched-chain amino acid aminotransferase